MKVHYTGEVCPRCGAGVFTDGTTRYCANSRSRRPTCPYMHPDCPPAATRPALSCESGDSGGADGTATRRSVPPTNTKARSAGGLLTAIALVSALALMLSSCASPRTHGDGYLGPAIIPGSTNAIPAPTY